VKKYSTVLLIVIIVLSTFYVQAETAEEQPMFLLGQNEKAEVIIAGKTISLELGKNPIQLITNSEGRKLILCAGEANKAGNIEQGASLRLLAPDLKSYEKTVQCDSSLTAYAIDNDQTTVWLAVRGGVVEKENVKPKVYRVSLNSLEVLEKELESIPCDVTVSGDGQWMAVTELGGAETPNSFLTIYEADSMVLAGRFDIAKNPGFVMFNNENDSLVVAGYGYKYQENFKIPTKYFIRLKEPVPAGADVIDLLSLQSQKIDLGIANNEFIVGNNATIYTIVSEEMKGIVRAVGPKGLLWERNCDFVPKYIQERPGTEEVWIIGGKNISIIEKTTGEILKSISAPNEVKPFLFLENSAYAYGYNMNNRKLNIMNLDNLSIEKTLAAGSTGFAVLKTAAFVASSISYYDSLQPRYVNGVRMPQNVQPVHWINSPQGNIVPCLEKNKLYMLNSFLAQIYTYDLQKDEVDKKLGNFGQNSMYLQMAPNRKYVVLVSGDGWKLISTETDKAVLNFNPSGVSVRLAFQAAEAPTPYFSPDGKRIYIPDKSKITVIDLEKAKKLANLKSDTKDAMICW